VVVAQSGPLTDRQALRVALLRAGTCRRTGRLDSRAA
jgi:hypothetical protein